MIRLALSLETAIRALLRPVVFAVMAALVVVITTQIVTRVLFSATGWTEEVARFLLVWLTFLGATLALAEGRHIAVTVLTDRLPRLPARALSVLGHLSAALFLGALAWIGWRYMNMQSYQKSAALRVPMMYIYSVIPLTCGVMAGLSLVSALAGGSRSAGSDLASGQAE
ncbi:TRAP transporter small permease [Mesobaculum littorinae]|uniref:TRAP transporter small permease protein n=1 Tax=Mesobaculum littorinae TaxID=2486419 RepID=A0A438AMA2_9RHOB|nr:TRAP transporter small permease [Mesobaculum littorinae]RVV99973.1 TRAP transporter small permease [Mesobaculum littorinae]